MALERRSNTQYWYSTFQIDGKRYIRSTKTTDKKLAQKIDQQYYKEALEQSKLGGNKITLKVAMELNVSSKKDNPRYQNQIQTAFNWIEKNFDTSINLDAVNNRWLTLV